MLRWMLGKDETRFQHQCTSFFGICANVSNKRPYCRSHRARGLYFGLGHHRYQTLSTLAAKNLPSLSICCCEHLILFVLTGTYLYKNDKRELTHGKRLLRNDDAKSWGYLFHCPTKINIHVPNPTKMFTVPKYGNCSPFSLTICPFKPLRPCSPKSLGGPHLSNKILFAIAPFLIL